MRLTVTKVGRADGGAPGVGQPRAWTFIEFEAPLADTDRLADAPRGSLDEALGWICDVRNSAWLPSVTTMGSVVLT